MQHTSRIQNKPINTPIICLIASPGPVKHDAAQAEQNGPVKAVVKRKKSKDKVAVKEPVVANGDAFDYLGFLSKVCIVPYEKLDIYRTFLRLDVVDQTMISMQELRSLLHPLADGLLSDSLIDYIMCVLDFDFQTSYVQKDFRLYAIALLAETVVNLPANTKSFIINLKFRDNSVIESFRHTKRAFLSADAAQNGVVKLKILLGKLGVINKFGGSTLDRATMDQLMDSLNGQLNMAGELSFLNLLANLAHFSILPRCSNANAGFKQSLTERQNSPKARVNLQEQKQSVPGNVHSVVQSKVRHRAPRHSSNVALK